MGANSKGMDSPGKAKLKSQGQQMKEKTIQLLERINGQDDVIQGLNKDV